MSKLYRQGIATPVRYGRQTSRAAVRVTPGSVEVVAEGQAANWLAFGAGVALVAILLDQ